MLSAQLQYLEVYGLKESHQLYTSNKQQLSPYQSAAKDRTGDLTCYVFKFCLHHVQQTCIICSAYCLHVTKLLTSVIDHYFHTDGSKYMKNPLDVGDSTARGVVICVKAA